MPKNGLIPEMWSLINAGYNDNINTRVAWLQLPGAEEVEPPGRGVGGGHRDPRVARVLLLDTQLPTDWFWSPQAAGAGAAVSDDPGRRVPPGHVQPTPPVSSHNTISCAMCDFYLLF